VRGPGRIRTDKPSLCKSAALPVGATSPSMFCEPAGRLERPTCRLRDGCTTCRAALALLGVQGSNPRFRGQSSAACRLAEPPPQPSPVRGSNPVFRIESPVVYLPQPHGRCVRRYPTRGPGRIRTADLRYAAPARYLLRYKPIGPDPPIRAGPDHFPAARFWGAGYTCHPLLS
jgi:hypothetical protein